MTTEADQDPYIKFLQKSPIYHGGLKSTIDTAFTSYKVARILSIVLFVVGISLLIFSVSFSILSNDGKFLALIFGTVGTANIIALLLYRPIERIQLGVNELKKSQIAFFSFIAQYDSIVRFLATTAEMPFSDPNRNSQMELERSKYLSDVTTQLIISLQ